MNSNKKHLNSNNDDGSSLEAGFELHPQLSKDSTFIMHLRLCELRIINDATYPWFLLVPRRAGLTEPHQLSLDEQHLLTIESRLLSQAIEKCFSPAKLNIATIGNMVPQLHMHHIARYEHDPAWPKPVWGFAEAIAYSDKDLLERIDALKQCIFKLKN